MFRRKSHFPVLKERLELPDGDFLDLAWVGKKQGPIILLLHGLRGSIQSHYINGMLSAINQQSRRAVLMHFRGCSGEPNRLERSYHSGETGDLEYVLRELKQREPNTLIYVVGYSLGGNVLLKALVEGNISKLVTAAVAVSVPFNLSDTVDHLCKGFSRIYQWKLMRELLSFHKAKFGAVKKLKTLREFDEQITAPLHGFRDAHDYYSRSSSYQFLQHIQPPTLILHAKNDPFTPSSSLPALDEVSKSVTLKYRDQGGHVGFISGQFPWKPEYWLEHTILEYLGRF